MFSILSQMSPNTILGTISTLLILSSHLRLGLPSGLFPLDFPTKILYAITSYPMCATCLPDLFHLILDFFIVSSPSVLSSVLKLTQCG
jgi:hypothetical protein